MSASAALDQGSVSAPGVLVRETAASGAPAVLLHGSGEALICVPVLICVALVLLVTFTGFGSGNRVADDECSGTAVVQCTPEPGK